ncbi:MAG: hypothetical protein FH761_02180 [Firmicutes bacterium]|nr:hypothetical protein [Bacillota bacterium]
MKITNDLMGKLLGNKKTNVELKNNDIYSAQIKERFSNNEALVQIRGKEFKVKFQDGLPKNNRALIQVTKQKNDITLVKNIKTENTEKKDESDVTKVLTKLGIKPTAEMKKVAKALMEKGIPITRETLKNIERFIGKADGNISEKIDTIERMSQKGIELTEPNLHAAHEALHGDEIQRLLLEVEQGLESGSMEDNINKIAEEKLLSKEAINEIRELIFKGEDLNKILEIINEKISNKDMAEQLEKALHTANALKTMGYEKEGIDRLIKVLDQLESTEVNSAGVLNESRDIQPSSKAFLMSRVSEKMNKATKDFTDVKREVIRNIDTITQVTKEAKTNVHSHVKGLIENSIDVIDKTILKSDITLFADMKTERTLIGLSSKLAEARRYLSKGQNNEATKILNEVKNKLMNLKFKPSENKIIHGATKESMFSQKNSVQSNSLPCLIDKAVNNLQNQQPSARNIMDLFRALGLNYESEAAQKLTGGMEELTKQDIQKNIKAMMLKLVETEGKGLKDSSSNQSVVKAINNLTGQQLLSKQDSNPHHQNMFFNIPFKVDGNINNVKLFVNGRKQNEKIDWENSSLYFLIDTKKMGPTGIQISSTERNLSITIKNDNKNMEDKITPLSDKFKESLEEIGYNVVGLNFTKLNSVEKDTESSNSSKTLVIPHRLNKKGFDFKV